MIKLVIFIIIILLVINSFSINYTFFTNGFSYIQTFYETLPQFFTFIKDTITTLFNLPLIGILLGAGIAFLIISYGLSMIGDENK